MYYNSGIFLCLYVTVCTSDRRSSIYAEDIVGVGLIRKPEKIEVHKEDIKYLFLRSFCGTIGIVCNFYAIDHLVLSDANMLNKLSPFFAIIFSYFLLKEKLTLFQGVAVVVAFIGALFIIKPTGNMANSAAFVGMMGGAGAGAAYTYVRLLGKRGVNGKLVIMCFSAFSCLTAAVFLIWRSRRTDLCYQSLLLCSGKRTFCV